MIRCTRATRARVWLHAAAVGVGVALAGGCASAGFRTAAGFREQNRRNLERLSVGMSRKQVFEIMGTESLGRPLGSESGGPLRTARDTLGVTQVQIPIGARAPLLQNPYRTAVYLTGSGTWEVLFYYTRMVDDDGRITDEELTPVVLHDDMLVGLGWEYWRETARAEGITPE